MKNIFSILLIFPLLINAQLSEKNYRVYSVKQQKEVTLNDVISDFKNYDVLFVGEEHNDSVCHYLEKQLLELAYNANGKNTALSMEMFERDVQPIMNEYLQGSIREKNFVKDARAWSNYRDYKPLVEFAKEKHLDVICANAAGRYSNLAGRLGQDGLQKLPQESKNYFAPLPYDTATGKYHDKLVEMGGHNPMPGFNMIIAQNLWDATMAYSIAEYLKKHKGVKVVQVNGRFHSDEGFAVAAQLKKYAPKAKALIVSTGSEDNFENPDWSKLTNLGDYIIICDPKVPKTY